MQLAWRRRQAGLLLGCFLGFLPACASWAQPLPAERPVSDLSLTSFIQRVLDHNESVQMRMLDVAIGQRLLKGARGIFEPELVGSYDHVATKRENTVEQQRSLGVPTFDEANNIYNGGLESLVPTGARIRLGYTLRDLNNNLGTGLSTNFQTLRFYTNQYQTFFGFSLTQPLLRNFGPNATMAESRLAALASQEAFHEYRKQLMLVLSTAEAAYWNLYMAQEQMLFLRESVALAETILRDNRSRLDAGRGSELEVLEAEAGLGTRRAKQNEAWQNYYEAVNRMATLYSGSVISTNHLIVAIDSPQAVAVTLNFYESWRNAYELNPDYQIQKQKVLQEGVRIAYAKNQRWPQLDLKASYGLNGLGIDPGESWRDVGTRDFPSWSVGVEMRVPLAGGIKSRNDLAAAKLRQTRALLGLKEVEVQIDNGLDTAVQKVRTAFESINNYEAAVRFARDLLTTQVARLDVGQVESRKVLEVEADLFQAKNAVLEAKVLYQRSLLELSLIEGSVLKARRADLTQRELESKTSLLVQNGQVTEEQYRRFMAELRWRFENKSGGLDPTAEASARQALAQTTDQLRGSAATTAPMSPEDYGKARQVLHEMQLKNPPIPGRP